MTHTTPPPQAAASPARDGSTPRARRRVLHRVPVPGERAAGLIVLVVALILSYLGPMLRPFSPDALVNVPQTSPSATYWFGTDDLGRDVFVRVTTAIRIDLGITVAAVVLSLIIGVAFGVLIALSNRIVSEILQRFVDAILAIPYLIFVLAIVAFARSAPALSFLPAGIGAIVLALIITGWANYARITASQVRVAMQRENVIAARLLGYSSPRILFKHVMPTVVGPNIALAGSHAVLITAAAASLAFLGAGVTPPTPELGAIMQGGTPLISTAWWISVYPGAAIVLLGIGFSLIADARES